MGISRKYIVLVIILGISIMGCLPQGNREESPNIKPAYPIDTIGDYRLTIKIDGEKFHKIEDSCHYYTLKDGIIEVENISDIDMINKTISEWNLIIDSFYIYTKDTVYNIVTDNIDSSDSLSLLEQATWILKIPEAISLSCYESCVDISYRVMVKDKADTLSARYFSHKLSIMYSKGVIWTDIARYFSGTASFSTYNVISYIIPESTHVLIKVYNICGQVVDTLVNQIQPPGTFEKKWDADDSPNGIYFYRVTANGKTKTKKMVLLK